MKNTTVSSVVGDEVVSNSTVRTDPKIKVLIIPSDQFG